jgi:predicted nucleotidyltransferase
MAQAGTVVRPDQIHDLVRQIVERFRPQKVILFGSYSDGTPDQDSDVDLLVVMDTDEPPLHAAARIAAVIEHPFPIDVLVFRPSDFKESLERKSAFATAVMTKGTVLYEA